MPRTRSVIALVVPVVAGLLAAGLAPAQAAPERPASGATVPVPEGRGPTPSRPGPPDRTFCASDLDLPARGYVEQEFFYSGRANVYDATVAPGIGARPTPSPTAN